MSPAWTLFYLIIYLLLWAPLLYLVFMPLPWEVPVTTNLPSAAAWNAIPTFVISLEKDMATRGKPVASVLQAAGHRYATVFPGVDGRDPAAHATLESLGVAVEEKSPLTPGERGCAGAHLQLMQHLVANNLPGAFVFEDDAVPCNNYALHMEKVFPFLHGHEVVLLGHSVQRTASASPVVPGQGDCTHAYFISFRGAKKLLAAAKAEPLVIPVDWWLKKNADMGVVTTPAARKYAMATRRERSEGIVGQGLQYGSVINPAPGK